MSDSEKLIDTEEETSKKEVSGDFPSMGVDLIKKVNFKVAFFLLLIGLFLFSDIFIEKFLPTGYHEAGCANTNGTVVQLVLFVIAYICIDLLASASII